MSTASQPLVLDCRGRRCPLPIIDVSRRITEVTVGSTIVVVADDPAAGPDLRAWCRMRGHEFVSEASGANANPDGTPAYTLRRLH